MTVEELRCLFAQFGDQNKINYVRLSDELGLSDKRAFTMMRATHSLINKIKKEQQSAILTDKKETLQQVNKKAV
ncbi:hypothetical protein FGO68_gene764 [Halteria grandinella]|uniref:Uncharacterized protein n=1 Tax=Halteria grandinella TaxID=5974 RepID=A0A8J8P6B8_HALGN|nr:hypothetical protein FGO68_gene764 [Halteria grandinella]